MDIFVHSAYGRNKKINAYIYLGHGERRLIMEGTLCIEGVDMAQSHVRLEARTDGRENLLFPAQRRRLILKLVQS